MNMYDSLLRSDLVPEYLIRKLIRYLCKSRLSQEEQRVLADKDHFDRILKKLSSSHMALSTDEANDQHYTVPTKFFQYVLGPNLKYSCCYWNDVTNNLADAETLMLESVIERAELKDNQSILELGCGWGSLCLTLAKKFPQSKIISVSNSSTQKQYIDQQIKIHNLQNLTVVTADINFYQTKQQFDRIISIEMFEHIRNYNILMERICGWLKPEGLVFIHHFCHQKFIYEFDPNEKSSWMAKNFFTNGVMPSDNTLDYFIPQFNKKNEWRVNGLNYHLTAESWLHNLKKNKATIINLFAEHYKTMDAKLAYAYWKIFFLSCAELFAFNNGNEWYVKHLLLSHKR